MDHAQSFPDNRRSSSSSLLVDDVDIISAIKIAVGSFIVEEEAVPYVTEPATGLKKPRWNAYLGSLVDLSDTLGWDDVRHIDVDPAEELRDIQESILEMDVAEPVRVALVSWQNLADDERNRYGLPAYTGAYMRDQLDKIALSRGTGINLDREGQLFYSYLSNAQAVLWVADVVMQAQLDVGQLSGQKFIAKDLEGVVHNPCLLSGYTEHSGSIDNKVQPVFEQGTTLMWKVNRYLDHHFANESTEVKEQVLLVKQGPRKINQAGYMNNLYKDFCEKYGTISKPEPISCSYFKSLFFQYKKDREKL